MVRLFPLGVFREINYITKKLEKLERKRLHVASREISRSGVYIDFLRRGATLAKGESSGHSRLVTK